jgi:hypothetical protein
MTRRLLLACLLIILTVPLQAQSPPPPAPSPLPASAAEESALTVHQQLTLAGVRLPLAVVLGAALALRPRKRGLPARSLAVIETQIILAAVGALIMLIVGASLARAFGIVGVASLIRYRSKIDDPKDAVVMLSALAVGLGSGVGLYVLAAISTAFLVALLWIIEAFEPSTMEHFELTVTAKGKAEALGPRVERILRRYRLPFESRALSADEVSYHVEMPLETPTDPITHSIVGLEPAVDIGVVWAEKKAKTK